MDNGLNSVLICIEEVEHVRCLLIQVYLSIVIKQLTELTNKLQELKFKESVI